ncbi:MAG: hypothetical protein Q9157_006131 [Trypethelium eluteriae]
MSGRVLDQQHQLNPIDRNHSELVKFALHDEMYDTVSHRLQYLCQIASSRIYQRFPNLEFALHDAVENGNGTLTESLLRCGADPQKEVRSTQNVLTPIHLAAAAGHSKVIQTLIKYGAKHTPHDLAQSSTTSPLHFAAWQGRAKSALLLLAMGANVMICGALKNTPLHFAAMKGHPDLVDILVGHGAHINAQNYQGATPLHHALEAARGNNTDRRAETIRRLVALGARINILARDGKTALGNAIYHGLAKALDNWLS